MKQITITVPDNCELKQDGNTYTIVEKEKKLTYADVARKLFCHGYTYINGDGAILNANSVSPRDLFDATNCTSKKQATKLLAINKLMNVANYLNGCWKPNWINNEPKYFIYITDNQLIIDVAITRQCLGVYFKSKELAKQAIEILGEETIKLALCTDY